jgi:hypothetical protein
MSLLNEASFLVTPNGYKEDKLYAAIPTNGNGDMTVTRATAATRVNENGLVNLLEGVEEVTNGDFSNGNTDWTPFGSTFVVSNANPFNGNDTALFTASGVNAAKVTQSISTVIGNTYHLSCYAQYNSGDNTYIEIRDVLESPNGIVVNSGVATFTFLQTSFTATSTASVVTIRERGGNNNASCYLYGLSVKKVNNVPRIDYTGGGCPSILLEPLRTNLLTYSEQFNNDPPWSKTNLTVTPNDTTAPDGTMTADSITTTPGVLSYIRQSTTQPAGTYTLSFFAKPQLGIGRIHVEKFTNNPGTHYFDLDLGVVTGSGESTLTITPYPNGWYRCTATRTFDSSITFGTGAIYLAVYGQSATLTTIFFWGAQLEEGAYPTSYIPTTIRTITRSADVMIVDNIHTNNLITNTGGTWFVHLINNVPYTRDAFNVGISIRSVSSSTSTSGVDSLEIRNTASTLQRLSIGKRISGAYSGLFDTTTDTVKLAIKWNGATANVFVNGAEVVGGTVFTTVNMGFLGSNGNDVSKYIKQMALFPTPLSDPQCQALTTL